MVRETRHLWVGNLPDNVREDRIREHFKRYGRVQNVKLLGRPDTAGASTSGASGVCATVAFMDIKSASKAHNVEHVLEERTLTTEYYEPVAIPPGAPSAGSSPAGSGYSGSSSSVNSGPAPPTPAATSTVTTTSASTARYHLSGGEELSPTCALAATAAAPANWRGTNDSATEYCRRGSTPAAYGRYARSTNAPYQTPPSNVERTTPHHRWYSSGERGATGGDESTPSTPGGGTDSGRRRRRSGSGSSRSDSSSDGSDSRGSSPSGHHASHSASGGRPLAICVRNLPTRSTDTSLKDGLYHEYKKHGKVVWVKVVGQNADRYAVVRFKKPSDVEKALEVSQDKLFFGCKISVAPHQSCDEDAESAKPYETDIDEYHPKATRTLFIGNLEKDVTSQQLRDKFKHFGRIIEIDIKKGSNGGAGYAFCQYAAISSVVEAIRTMDGEYVGGSRVKLGFGKPVATTCVWVDGLTETTEKQVLACVARCGAATSVCVDRAAGAALVHFEQAGAAGAAVRELRRVAAHASAVEPDRPRLAVDYASRECQEAFYEQLEKHGGSVPLPPPDRAPPDPVAAVPATATRYPTHPPAPRHELLRYDSCGSRSRASSYSRTSSRTPRYSTLEHYDPTDYAADRRYRVYDELGGSPQPDDIASYEDRLQSVVVSSPHRSRRHRHDSSPEDRKHSKERHRSVTTSGLRRSRSGSRGGERHSGRRRHRRRCEGSGSRGSRAGTPLRDEPDAPPCEPRRGPRDRLPRPMSLPLPRFALQLLRAAPSAPRPVPSAAPDSPPRPHSASSSSGGSAPHSPSIEERIRSLDEKLSGTRGAPEPPDRSRLRHRLLEVDINEVKPSEVVRSLLAKRSVFDEDSERLEGAVRAPSPGGSPRSRPPPVVPRALRYPFPVHPHPPPATADADALDRPADPRLKRPEKPYVLERLGKFSENDYKAESRIRLRTLSSDKLQTDCMDRWQSPNPDTRPHSERLENITDQKKHLEPKRRNSIHGSQEGEWKERTPSNETDLIPKRRGSIHNVQEVQVKKEIQVSTEAETELKRRDSIHVMENIQVKIEKDPPSNVETEPKTSDSTTLVRELPIKIEKLETDPIPNSKNEIVEESVCKKEPQSPVASITESKTCESNSRDSEAAKTDDKHPTNVSEPQTPAPKEIKPLNETQQSVEDKEREIKEAIELMDPDKKDIQSLINEDRILRENSNEKLVEHAEHASPDKKSHCEMVVKKECQPNTDLPDFSSKLLEKYSDKTSVMEPFLAKSEMSQDIPKSACAGKGTTNVVIEIEKHEIESCKDILIQNHINKELHEFEMQHGHLNSVNTIKTSKSIDEIGQELIKNNDKNGKERYNQNMILEAFHTKLEKENIQFDKHVSKDQLSSSVLPNDNKALDTVKHTDGKAKSERDKSKYCKDREMEKQTNEKDKPKSHRYEKQHEKAHHEKGQHEKTHHDKKTEKDSEKYHKSDKDKSKHADDKKPRHDHHRKDKSDKEDDKKRDKRKDDDVDLFKVKRDDKHKHDRSKKDSGDSKRDSKKESDSKSRKSSRDESVKDLQRKDSTDSSTSRASHESSKIKELEHNDIKKEDSQPKIKSPNEILMRQGLEKDISSKVNDTKPDHLLKIKPDKEEKEILVKNAKNNTEQKYKLETSEKHRHYSLDSPSLDTKRKERLNSCSSLPSNLGQKRRISSHESEDLTVDDVKKCKPAVKTPDRRDSKDARATDKPKTTKFNKNHFAKIIESKTKDDKKNQVKPPDGNIFDFELVDTGKTSESTKSEPENHDDIKNDPQLKGLQNDLDFLATLELRSSEEDERQKALRKEMKEKKRIQQLQQIQELQMQQDALQQSEIMNKLKDEKKKCDDKKKEAAREKRMSIERKSREDKSDSGRRKNRNKLSTDSSDSDEPKKHSIFDVVDDEPAYISMYDKVKARSCKNMQKQEEEKRQEKIKAKFSQLKQSRAKREEKKRSSWDEDSDSEHDRRKPQKSSVDSSTDDEHFVHIRRCDKLNGPSFEFGRNKSNDYFSIPCNEEDSRNKLSRKISRSRIISDTSDDDGSKRSFSKSPSFFTDIRKEFLTDYESLQHIRDEMPTKESIDKIKKNSLFNLFGKSDSDDSKLKSSFSSDKSSLTKNMSNDFSSEGETVMCNRILNNIRKKHKKKQKKHKTSFSDEDSKIANSAMNFGDTPHPESRRHITKKEKRRDKVRDSIDADDSHDERTTKLKKDKKTINSDLLDSGYNNRKEGKMEDIFGPISDDSDREESHSDKLNFSKRDSTFGMTNGPVDVISNFEDKHEEIKHKKEKRRKDKNLFTRDDENSLDVDAVSKAIEARLFAETAIDDDDQDQNKNESSLQNIAKSTRNESAFTEHKYASIKSSEKHMEKTKREFKDRKKKKKKSREDRQNRKDHHHHFNHHDKSMESPAGQSMLLDIPLPSDLQKPKTINKSPEKNISECPSLPCLTDSPSTTIRLSDSDTKNRDSDDATDCSGGDHSVMEVEYVGKQTIEVNDIPMPPPLENTKNDSDVPLPTLPDNETSEIRKVDAKLATFETSANVSDDAVRSISHFEVDSNKPTEKLDNLAKADKKSDEKPRAIISQEETADAVAALLGESFGEKDDAFASCFEETDNDSTHQIETESSITVNENILEEDAEEMRQAVQNLNACEMEMKPDTPVSDNDLLLIDTDTEEADDPAPESSERTPTNVITSSQSTSNQIPQKFIDMTAKAKTTLPSSPEQDSIIKTTDMDVKIHLPKREPILQVSSATPVITSVALTNNKSIESPIASIKPVQLPTRDNGIKPTHITANIVQIRGPQGQAPTALRPIVAAQNRGSAPYHVINHMIRSQVPPNMQPPMIKIPDQHILYQRPQGIVISPRLSNDPRMQSPKVSPQGEGMPSPRLAFLSTSPQSLNSVGITTPNTLQQRSPGQVTVVRMQQPPLSPIQAMHLPPGARAMVSPNRPNSVLVQTQGSPIHLNRVPVTPVLAPISKQMISGNINQQNKITGNPNLFHQQKVPLGDCRRIEHRFGPETAHEHSKIILTSTSLQHSTNPTVMAQNRLISMQNAAIHAGNLHMNNKILTNNIGHPNDKKEILVQKPELHNNIAYSTAPIIRVAGVNHSAASIIQSASKPIMSTIQDSNSSNRGQSSNVIHTLNSQRLLTSSPMSNVIQIDTKCTPSVLSMTAIRPPTVLAKLQMPVSSAVTSQSSNVVMAPLLLKTTTLPSTIRTVSNVISQTGLTEKQMSPKEQHTSENKHESEKVSDTIFDNLLPEIQKESTVSKSTKTPIVFNESIAKCETDFEELLKNTTNEIKVTNTSKKLEVNVGKSASQSLTATHVPERVTVVKVPKEEKSEDQIDNPEQKNIESKSDTADQLANKIESGDNIMKVEPEFVKKENDTTVQTLSLKSLAGLSMGLSKPELSDAETNFHAGIFQETNCIDGQIKSLDENDSWSAKDVNIESVIKKVDSLCNDIDNERCDETTAEELGPKDIPELKPKPEDSSVDKDSSGPMDIETELDNSGEVVERNAGTVKRGGRNVRGRKIDKAQDRVQTRQIAKPNRGGGSAKRGRGRTKVDKKMQNAINNTGNNFSGDIYDFHEDSGDETASLNKNERPRLILTIKSPLSGQTNAIATSTLSITPKDEETPKEQAKVKENTDKEEKPEDFMLPSATAAANTRKSRRLQEKDSGQRTTVDDVIDDVVKGATAKPSIKDNKKRPLRQTGAKTNLTEKTSTIDKRKSPRGVKRTRDRSLSDASADSNSCSAESIDEKAVKKDELPKAQEAKIPKLAELLISKPEVQVPQATKPIMTAPVIVPTTCTTTAAVLAPPTTTALPATSAPTIASMPQVPVPLLPAISTPAAAPTPIMKPPKKMISEISAKLASAFEAAASVRPTAHILPMVSEKPASVLRDIRDPDFTPAVPAPATVELMTAATGDARVGFEMVVAGSGEAALARRLEVAGGGEAALARRLEVAGGGEAALARRLEVAGGGEAALARRMEVAGAAEAGDARVQSPALPHRPPDAHRLPDRPTPHLIRGGDGEGVSLAGVGIGAGAGMGLVGAALAGARAPRPYVGPASLPRGAHHPPQPLPSAAVKPLLPSHHHHPGAASRVTLTSIPTISPQGQIGLGEGMYPHFSHQHYQMYQQHFRATQHETRATPSPYSRTLEAEGCEAPAPPLELRRPPSARVPRPAHSPSPADRLIMYAAGCGRSPPPAHGTSRLPGALPPTTTPGPPHASQVPREADSLQMLLQRYPVMWQGLLALKNDSAAVQMHFVGGNMAVGGDTLPRHTDGSTPPLRIAQRMRLEPQQLDQVHRKMKLENEHCILLALPCGRDHMDVLQQSTNLTSGFITYLQSKQAAGIVNVAPPGHQQALYTVHIFPSCDFANENLNRIAPDLMHRVADIAHLLIVVTTV